MKYIILSILGLGFLSVSEAQKRGRLNTDTTKPESVIITSAYKPVLKPTPKINFSANIPATGQAKPELNYNVPAQNLFFTYQPPGLQPLALDVKNESEWPNHAYVKAGFGNFSTPYLEAAASMGDGKTMLAEGHLKFLSQKGKQDHQQLSKIEADINGIYKGLNHDWNGGLYFNHDTRYQYGYEPKTLLVSKDSVRNRFTTVGLNIGMNNRNENELGLSYKPKLNIQYFSDNHKSKEFQIKFNGLFSKNINDQFSISIKPVIDWNSFKSDYDGSINNLQFNNSIFYIEPEITYSSANLLIKAGFTPAWDNSDFKALPNFYAEAKVAELPFKIFGGWKGRFEKNTYAYLAGVNPFLYVPETFANARHNEIFAGIKGSTGNNISYLAKAAFTKSFNQALFINDTLTGKGFLTVYEPEMSTFSIHAEMSYLLQEKLSASASFTMNQFSSLSVNEKAWHLLPIKLKAGMRWQMVKDLLLKTEVLFFEGPQYLNKEGIGQYSAEKLKPGIDANLGVEFNLMPKLDLWLQFNNIFNNRYERWHRYEVLGFQVLGGIIYHFK